MLVLGSGPSQLFQRLKKKIWIQSGYLLLINLTLLAIYKGEVNNINLMGFFSNCIINVYGSFVMLTKVHNLHNYTSI